MGERGTLGKMYYRHDAYHQQLRLVNLGSSSRLRCFSHTLPIRTHVVSLLLKSERG